jgi:hypothetical protein
MRVNLSCLQASRIHGISVFGKRLSRKNDNVVAFPFAFHIAVQQPFNPLWSRLLLYELEPSRASFALCFKSLLMTHCKYIDMKYYTRLEDKFCLTSSLFLSVFLLYLINMCLLFALRPVLLPILFLSISFSLFCLFSYLFFCSPNVQTVSEAHKSQFNGHRVSFLGVKRPQLESDYSPPSSAPSLRISGAIIYSPTCPTGVDRYNLTSTSAAPSRVLSFYPPLSFIILYYLSLLHS